MPTGHIHYEVDDGVATITIDRPEKRVVYQGMAAEVSAHVAETGRLLQECFHSEDHSEDHAEGVASFLERRPARFTGR